MSLSRKSIMNIDIYHPPLDIHILANDFGRKFANNIAPTYNYKTANFLQLLAVDWSFLQSYSSVESACNQFYYKVDE